MKYVSVVIYYNLVEVYKKSESALTHLVCFHMSRDLMEKCFYVVAVIER